MARWTVCSSPGCPELAPVGVGRCEAHQRPAWQNPSAHTRNRPPDWAARRAAVLRRDHHRCRKCKAARAGHVDHIVRVADGGSWEPGNLQTLCKTCHDEKTAYENRRSA